jgi:hypothetical protein
MAPTAGFSSTPARQPACRTMPDERIAGYVAGRQVRTGIVMGYRNEAELAAERKRLGGRVSFYSVGGCTRGHFDCLRGSKAWSPGIVATSCR